MNIPLFTLGDMVEWTSQSGGYTKTKTGVIVEVVAPGKRPDRSRFFSLHMGCGGGRKTFSFVVDCGKRAPKHYWPNASLLRMAE